MRIPITAVVITKNEELAIARCLAGLQFCDQILVIDSSSTDRTCEIATDLGAEVVQFKWNGQYPKKKQWGMEHDLVRNDWVLHIDGDEIVSRELADEISQRALNEEFAAFDIPLAYHFTGRELRFGHQVLKRSLVRRSMARFPEVGDLDFPGITEVEGHYQPVIDGQTGRMHSKLIHDDPDPMADWISRHNKYSDWEARLATTPSVRMTVRGSRTTRGGVFDRLPLKPFVFFCYSYIARLGFLDGRAGLNYSIALAWYYWLTGVKTRELKAGRS